jgi:prepilin-type N-terminal cleavage/methylation domain-containing protein
MSPPKHYPAFTLMELIVVLSLSAIVTSIAYAAFNILYQQYYIQRNTNSYNYKVTLFERLLTRDFGESESVISTDDGVICQMPSGLPVVYGWGNNEYILRSKGIQSDTLYIQSISPQLYFKQTIVNGSQNLVDRVVLSLKMKDEDVSLGAIKYYGANVLMNY